METPNTASQKSTNTNQEDLSIEGNQKLVSYTAYKLFKRFKNHPILDYDDFISAGNLGLLDAIRMFDPNKGVKFKTYAYHKIRSAILDEWRRHDILARSHRDKINKDPNMVEPKVVTFGKISNGLQSENEDQEEIVSKLLKIKDNVSIESQAQFNDMVEFLFQDLKDRDKEIAIDYYVNGLSIKKISVKHSVTDSWIFQILQKRISSAVQRRTKQYYSYGKFF